MGQSVKIVSIEPYIKELKRKEFINTPYRIFNHPNLNSAYIVSKDGIVVGMCNITVLRKTFRSGAIFQEHECNNFEGALIEFKF